ncbi:hypothetical protein [Kineococcus sp. SYSU DK006]|uniref:hypothetical protein n=1 Tax=Kineococcus sp. SYSU DK006 TaxID=3383127 RepID=UPI003D7D589A
MEDPLHAALLRAAEQRVVVDLTTMGEPADAADLAAAVVAIASDPLAPLAAQALTAAVQKHPGEPWSSAAVGFAAGLGDQRSVLALQESIDVLLGEKAIAPLVGASLHGVMLTGLDALIQTAPSLAAARLEVAVRTVLAEQATPFLLLDRLTRAPAALPEEYLAVLPRLIGIALDTWQDNEALTVPLESVLQQLLDSPVDADAAHEIAVQQMRRALSSADGAQVIAGLAEAVDLFKRAEALEEARDDARAYRAACQAVVAFTRQERTDLQQAVESLTATLSRRDAWYLGMHEPDWRAGTRRAETAWLALIMDLRQAAEHLDEESWLDAYAAAGQLAAVYQAERAIDPAAGVAAAVRPVITNALSTNATLLHQLQRMVAQDHDREASLLPAAVGALLHAVQTMHVPQPAAEGLAGDFPRTVQPASEVAGDQVRRDQIMGRIRRVAPALLDLGADTCIALSALDDDQLSDVAATMTALIPKRMPEHLTLTRMREQIVATLEVNPRFAGETRAAVTALLERTLSFLLDRYERGGPIVPSAKDIIAPTPEGEDKPVEADLQFEFHVWLAAPWEFAGRVRTEVRDIATGRADVLVRFGEIELVTEVKRELTNATAADLERRYLGQAAQYSGAGEPFSQLLVLDLTDHSGGAQPLEDLAWARERRVTPDASPQHVIVALVIGNRPTPRAIKAAPAPRRPRKTRDA